MGDFNAIRTADERVGSNMIDHEAMDGFNNYIDLLIMEECSVRGPFFSWYNKTEEGIIYSRIDRILANESWFEAFGMADEEVLIKGFLIILLSACV